MENNNSLSQTISYTIPVTDLAIQTNVEDLTCIICLNICFKPVIITCCEKLLCLECIKMMLKISNLIKCPNCNDLNIKFEKPSKLINRLFENLTFNCSNKNKGCTENIKYHFYFEHIFNSCKYDQLNLSYCKNCLSLYHKNNQPHICFKEKDDVENISELEKKLNELYLPSNLLSSTNGGNKKESIVKMTIPKVHNHELVLTNRRLKEEYEQGWLCELCNDNIRNPSTKSYHCEICTFDVCEKCMIFIAYKVSNRACHSHELNLEIRELEWECDICDESYYKRRSWYCDLCQFDVCVKCYWK